MRQRQVSICLSLMGAMGVGERRKTFATTTSDEWTCADTRYSARIDSVLDQFVID
jgi:hypothetical protein